MPRNGYLANRTIAQKRSGVNLLPAKKGKAAKKKKIYYKGKEVKAKKKK